MLCNGFPCTQSVVDDADKGCSHSRWVGVRKHLPAHAHARGTVVHGLFYRRENIDGVGGQWPTGDQHGDGDARGEGFERLFIVNVGCFCGVTSQFESKANRMVASPSTGFKLFPLA